MAKILIVYYSRTGTTKKVAEALQTKFNCDIESVESVKNRSGAWGYIFSGKEATQRSLTEIKPAKQDPSGYDLVIVGTPIWSWNVSSIIRTYLDQQKGKIKKAAFFCTMGGSGHERAFSDMEKTIEVKPITTMSLLTKQVVTNNFQTELDQFAQELSK